MARAAAGWPTGWWCPGSCCSAPAHDEAQTHGVHTWDSCTTQCSSKMQGRPSMATRAPLVQHSTFMIEHRLQACHGT